MNRFRGRGGGGSAKPVGVVKVLSFSYSFVSFYFFEFHENSKNKNTREHSENWLHHGFASDYYISIILHHTVASARRQHSIASHNITSGILHQPHVPPAISSLD